MTVSLATKALQEGCIVCSKGDAERLVEGGKGGVGHKVITGGTGA